MKRIIYVSYSELTDGSAAHVHVNEIIKNLETYGWQVELVSPKYARTRKRGGLRRLLEFCRISREVKRLVNSEDVVYFRNHFAGIRLAKYLHRRQIPVLQEVVGTLKDVLSNWPMMRLFIPFIRRSIVKQLKISNAIIVESVGRRVMLNEIGITKNIHVIPNGADTEKFAPGIQLESFSLRKPYALYFGTLSKWQGIETIIEAFGSLAWPKEINLVIVGDGPLRGNVQKLAMENTGVEYLDFVRHNDLPEIIANALVSLSVQEDTFGRAKYGFLPLKVMESISCGTPVIITDYPGQRELIGDGECGVIIRGNNPSELANAVSKFLNEDFRSFCSKNARALSVSFSWIETARRIHAILESFRTNEK